MTGQPDGPAGWPKPGDRVHYSAPVEGATGGGPCQPAVIAAYGEGDDDVFAELRSGDGDLIAERSMRYEAGPGRWGTDNFESYCGGTWHARCKIKP